MFGSRWRSLAAGLALCLAMAPWVSRADGSQFLLYGAPAGKLPATRHALIDGLDAAVLPSGRLLTPAGSEISVEAPKPFGLALSPDGKALATINSGSSPFSVTLVTGVGSSAPRITRIGVWSSFLGLAFSPDGSRFYASGGESGLVLVGDTTSARFVGAVNLNGAAHPLASPLDPAAAPAPRFKGTYPGRLTVSRDGRYLYVVDQGAFQVDVVDTRLLQTGIDGTGKILEPNNFSAVVARIPAGRYPFDVALSPDGKRLYVVNVGTFQYQHLTPTSPTGDPNADYPLCLPGAGYPDESSDARTIQITKVDPRQLPDTLRDPAGIRCGFIPATLQYEIPGLGSPNAPESNSVWIYDVSNPIAALRRAVVKTGPRIAEQLQASLDDGDETVYAGAHPNAVVVGRSAVYVANGNDDSVALFPLEGGEAERIALSPLRGADARLRGVQPVALAISPDGRTLYVSEAGLNAVAVVRLTGRTGRVAGHIPTGWWPAAVAVSGDGRTLYVSNARGRGAGPNNPTPPDNLGSPKSAVLGSVSIISVPSPDQLAKDTERVLVNNGFLRVPKRLEALRAKVALVRRQVKHVIFINKENATHDLLLGDITRSASGQPVDGEPAFSLGVDASPNHHALALKYAFGDNFFLEPSVSSDGHRWLTNTYTSELEETHWPASYGGRRGDAGDDPAVYGPYPGRLGFTDANASPEPNDLNERGSIYLHLVRNGRSFVNFGNGYEFAQVDEDVRTDPTGIRNHVNVPMEKVVRDRTDHLYPEFNTGIPDGILPEDPTRFSRFGRFRQEFQAHYVKDGRCALPDYVDLYYPNDHGGGANDIYPDGSQPWSFTRFVQDNDSALGATVDLLSSSPCWKDTVIFVVEDDTQNGYDHVDAHRSIFLAIGPSLRPGYVLKTHASLSSVFKTVDLILGIPPLNLYDAAASDLLELWPDGPGQADDRGYTSAPVTFDTRHAGDWARATSAIRFRQPDEAEVDLRGAIYESEGLSRKKVEGRW